MAADTVHDVLLVAARGHARMGDRHGHAGSVRGHLLPAVPTRIAASARSGAVALPGRPDRIAYADFGQALLATTTAPVIHVVR